MSDYAEYLARKKPRMPDAGFDPPAPRPAAGLRDYQSACGGPHVAARPGLRLRGLRRGEDEDRVGVGARCR